MTQRVKEFLAYDRTSAHHWRMACQGDGSQGFSPQGQESEEKALALFREMTEEERACVPEELRSQYEGIVILSPGGRKEKMTTIALCEECTSSLPVRVGTTVSESSAELEYCGACGRYTCTRDRLQVPIEWGTWEDCDCGEQCRHNTGGNYHMRVGVVVAGPQFLNPWPCDRCDATVAYAHLSDVHVPDPNVRGGWQRICRECEDTLRGEGREVQYTAYETPYFVV